MPTFIFQVHVLSVSVSFKYWTIFQVSVPVLYSFIDKGIQPYLVFISCLFKPRQIKITYFFPVPFSTIVVFPLYLIPDTVRGRYCTISMIRYS